MAPWSHVWFRCLNTITEETVRESETRIFGIVKFLLGHQVYATYGSPCSSSHLGSYAPTLHFATFLFLVPSRRVGGGTFWSSANFEVPKKLFNLLEFGTLKFAKLLNCPTFWSCANFEVWGTFKLLYFQSFGNFEVSGELLNFEILEFRTLEFGSFQINFGVGGVKTRGGG